MDRAAAGLGVCILLNVTCVSYKHAATRDKKSIDNQQYAARTQLLCALYRVVQDQSAYDACLEHLNSNLESN
jgi:hypothetical protein